MKIADIMSQEVVLANEDMTVSEVAQLLASNNIGGVPVLNADNDVVGMITEGDLLPKPKSVPFSTIKIPAFFGEWLKDGEIESIVSAAKDKKCSEIMTPSIVTIEHDADIGSCAELMAKRSIKRLPVVKDGKVVGIVTRADLVKAIAEKS